MNEISATNPEPGLPELIAAIETCRNEADRQKLSMVGIKLTEALDACHQAHG